MTKIVLGEDCLRIAIEHKKLRDALGLSSNPLGFFETPPVLDFDTTARISIRGAQTKILVGGDHERRRRNRDVPLIRAIARAHDWFERLRSGKEDSVHTIAKAENLTGSYVTRVLRLAFLAPDVVEQILNGSQSYELSTDQLTLHAHIPLCWKEQRFPLVK